MHSHLELLLNGYDSKGRCSHLPCGHWLEQNKPQKWIGRCSNSLAPLRVSGKGSPLPTCAPQRLVGTFLHTLRWSHGCCEERGATERTELGAAVPYSMVPSAAWDFQLGICAVVLAWENGPSALQSQHWQQERACIGADTTGTGRQVQGRALCVGKVSQTFLKPSLIRHSHLEKQI